MARPLGTCKLRFHLYLRGNLKVQTFEYRHFANLPGVSGNKQRHPDMTEHYSYFLEKTSTLIRKLISGQGTAKQRLLECEVEIVLSMSTPIPDDLKPLRDKILSNLNKKNAIKVGDKLSMTSFRHTLVYMKNKTAAKITLDIYDLYSEILFRDRFA